MSKWIKAEEQSMPDMFMNVLVAQDTGAVFIAQFDGVEGWISGNGLLIEWPSYWAPLPAAPKSADEAMELENG